MKKLRYICVQPRLLYYTWQVEVMINNFIKHGINPNDIDILVAWNPNDLTSTQENIDLWNKLVTHYSDVRFFFYQDTREDMNYIPSVYFNILKQHIKTFPELQTQPLYLYDCDSLFTKPIDFSEMLNDDVWYLSNTNHYINYDYIILKGQDIYDKMCEIIEIDPSLPIQFNLDSGGAQHIVKNTTYEYWDKVEKDSIKLYKYFCEQEPHYKGEDYPIQKWTAGMWSLLWNAWKFGHTTKVDKRLDFCWATDHIDSWDKVCIFHNAGVVDQKELFIKSNYINSLPYDIENNFSPHFCSYNYVNEILKTKEISCLI